MIFFDLAMHRSLTVVAAAAASASARCRTSESLGGKKAMVTVACYNVLSDSLCSAGARANIHIIHNTPHTHTHAHTHTHTTHPEERE